LSALEFVLLGDPVSHSLSPAIHQAAFAAWGIDARYRLRRVGADGLAAAVREAVRGGGGNVTLPHKQAVATLIEERMPDLLETGACNCFWMTSEGLLAGDNTDVAGFLAALDDLVAPNDEAAPDDPVAPVSEGRVLVLGAGGAARAVVIALGRLGVASVDLWNRTPENAHRLVAELKGGPGSAPIRVLDRRPRDGAYALVVNATRLGLDASDPLPITLEDGVAESVFDLVYGSGGTPWVRRAASLGIPACDGLLMLVHQAARSLERWFPDREPPIPDMLEAARAAANAAAGA